MSTQQNSPFSYLEKMSGWVFFGIIFLYTLLMTFQGLDLSDEGLNAVFYRNIYTNPEAVQYTFMFWLTGVIGGAFDYLFPGLGVWGLRFLGCLAITGTTMVTYRLLKPHLNKAALRLGLIFALLIITNNIRIFHYNYLCMLLFMLCASFLYAGLKRNKPFWILLAGAMVALEALARIPSIINLGLVLTIFYHGILHKTPFAKQLKMAVVFGTGFAASLGAMVLFMKATGQYDIYVGAVKLVMEMGSGGASSHYGIGKLLEQFFVLYGSAVKHGLFVAIPVIGAAMAVNLVKHKPYYRKGLIQALTLLLIAAFIYLIVRNNITHIIMVFLLTDLAMLASLFIFCTGKNKDIQVLMFMGLYIILTYPLGSSDGIYTVGSYTLWLSLPIAVDYFAQWLNLESNWKLESKSPGWNIQLQLTREQLRKIGSYGTLVIMFALLYHAFFYPFFDTNNRIRMTHSVNNKYMKGILTTKERAASINELLEQSKDYIQPGDVVLMYHTIPLIHYMTETKPFLRNSMPWLYEGSFFANELNGTVEKTGYKPVIIRQLIKTVAEAANWPDPPAAFDENWAGINAKRDEALEAFIQKYQYRQVWTNKEFAILIPAGKEVR